MEGTPSRPAAFSDLIRGNPQQRRGTAFTTHSGSSRHPPRAADPLSPSSLSSTGMAGRRLVPVQPQWSSGALGVLLLLFYLFSSLANGARLFQKAVCVFDKLEQKRTIFFVDGRVFLNYY